MTTFATSAAFSQAAGGAGINAWVSEIYAGLVTNCGLVQTNDTGQAAASFAGGQPSGTGPGNATGHYLFTFTDTLAQGGLTTTALNSGGSGYTSSAYTGLVVTGVTSGATSARASMTVSGGVAGNLTITTAGSGYYAGEKLTVTGIGAGTGANWTATVMSSGSPIVFRLDFGGGSATTDPQMWITLGSGSNGSGTINGSAGTTAMTQAACFVGNVVPGSLTQAYISRYVVNMVLGASNNGGHVGCFFKLGSTSTSAAVSNICYGGFHIFRSNDTGGNPTAVSATLITNSATTTGLSSAPVGIMQTAVFGSGVISSIYPITFSATTGGSWNPLPSSSFGTGQVGAPLGGNGANGTLTNGVAAVFPSIFFDGLAKFSAFSAIGFQSDIPVGVTCSVALIGATPLTFLSVGYSFGAVAFGNLSGVNSNSPGAVSYLVPWF